MDETLKFDVYLQDPLVAREDPLFGFDEIEIPVEPQIFDGPTSARFAVVDYNDSTGLLNESAKLDKNKGEFIDANGVLNRDNTDSLQFNQVQVWATLQRALKFFEEGQGLGRTIPWGFEGNRLIVVPHAGFGQNAYYDRESKSLQFYYYNDPHHPGKLVFTCLSADIIHHEFGHAILDGIRPCFIESHLSQTGALHESIGDITALLLLLRNNDFRNKIADKFGDELSEIRILSGIADEFGRTVKNQSYLRNADNQSKMSDVAGKGIHEMSTVLTGAVFKIMEQLSKQYVRRRLESKGLTETDRKKQAKTAFWNTINRMHRMAIQPLDFLPPIDATFRDYALAMLRMEEVSNPQDPYGYRGIMIKEFVKREILTEVDQEELMESDYLFDRSEVKFESYFSAYAVCKCKANAYTFIDENRKPLGIPKERDIIIADVYQAKKRTRQGRSLSTQFTIEYIWREEVLLEGTEYGDLNGAFTAFLCGGTLVFDNENNLLHWANKPGTEYNEDASLLKIGEERLVEFKENIKTLIVSNQLKLVDSAGDTLFPKSTTRVLVEKRGGLLHFKSIPHLNITDEHQNESTWQLSF